MLTLQDIRKKVNEFPDDKPVEELLDELMLLYKVEKGLEDIEKGNVTDWEEFKVEMESWSKSK